MTVQKAHDYDIRLAAAANKNKNQKLAHCKSQRPRCPFKAVAVPQPPDIDRDNGQTPTGDGSRGDCEIAQQVRPTVLSVSLHYCTACALVGL